jgi:hypothetical protein
MKKHLNDCMIPPKFNMQPSMFLENTNNSCRRQAFSDAPNLFENKYVMSQVKKYFSESVSIQEIAKAEVI